MNLICPICKTKLIIDNLYDAIEARCNSHYEADILHAYVITFSKNKITEYYGKNSSTVRIKIYHEMINKKCKTIICINNKTEIELNQFVINFYSLTLDDDIKKLLLLL